MRPSGLWAALLTPMEPGGGVDHESLAELAAGLGSAGVDGVVPLGTTGEFCEFSRRERSEILRTVVQAVPRLPVLAGVTGLSTPETCALAGDAAEAGVDGILVLPPLFWKMTEEGLLRYFRDVARAADLPMVIYDFPAMTGTAVPASVIVDMAVSDERVVGAKLTVRSIDPIADLLRMVRAERPDFSVVTGFEDLIPATLLAGGDGAISGMANICPDVLVSLVRGLRHRDPTAFGRYREVMDLFDVYTLTAPAIPGLKAVAAALGRLPRSTSRVDAGDPSGIDAQAHRWLAGRSAPSGTSVPS